MRPRLIIFAKAPIMGRAKTRLAKDIGVVHAKRIYRAMTAKIIRNVQNSRWDTVLAVTPREWLGRITEWEGLSQYVQCSGSLTPRLLQAFSDKGPTAVIGTDCPDVCAQDIAQAFSRLKRNSAVFGPAEDGGFWLIGLNGPAKPDTFDQVNWSTDTALADVEANIKGSVHRLRTLIDVDDLAALKAARL